jgi:pyridoxal biosynthesis lyase PdxS
VLAKVSRGLGEAMVGINVEEIPQPHRSPTAAGSADRVARRPRS